MMAIALQTQTMMSLNFATTNATILQHSQHAAHATHIRKRQRRDSLSQPPQKIRRITSSYSSKVAVSGATSTYSVRKENEIGESALANTSPHDHIVSSIRVNGGEASTRPSLDVQNFFLEHTEEEMKGYPVLSMAVRSHDLNTLRRLHKEGLSMRCSNKFGESLIHMACRRGYVDVVKFFVEEAGVSLRVRDDFGRTPLHDACWTCEPNEELMDFLVMHNPELLMMSDKRGHSPFQYARKEHWGVWNHFLDARKELIRSL
mmetsp:Transcript_20833/g.60656  ORF Transcript_20833/g.60656 Transcript_20833/m.60656 type:complete len:260 (-) Transcript_20833:21-800(-)